MREIKFRAWHKTNSSMIYERPLNRIGQDSQFGDDVILMQYTGLKDKNDKEIFEGDIIRTLDSDIEVVKWSDESVELSYGRGVCCFCGFVFDNECIIIGNIYENPELIE